ncbi:MAG TPA: UDP-N-acetylmuramoyl-L-alanyl-D-glutamate--2,6-diaminopimelate ligase [Candidatus Nanopelagicaceae bacterium]
MTDRPLSPTERSLSEIAAIVGVVNPDADLIITGMSHNSSAIEKGDIFLAFPGARVHGASYSRQAKMHGARAVLTDSYGATLVTDLPTLVVSDPRRSAGNLSAWFYNEPMRDMFSVGITGTNGKTTTTTLLHEIWTQAGRESGLIGTVETRIGDEVLASVRTTPESCDLQALAATMRERHVRNFAMEVSSHALSLERIRGSHFAVAGFTNLSQDHLDFHHTMDEYFLVKARLFSFEYADRAVINIDDAYGRRLADMTEIPVVTVSRQSARANWSIDKYQPHLRGSDVAIRGDGGILIEALLPLHGEYNLDNALMAVAIAYESGIDPIDIQEIFPRLTGAAGRFELVDLGQEFSAFVDYAHSPDAVTRVLAACHQMTSGRVIAVLGCGGDRDKSKRPLMGRALSQGSDVAVYTSDNPRSEDPELILSEMTESLIVQSPSMEIIDRKKAIEYAVAQADHGDIVIVLGKGHEVGQEIAGVILPFDDRVILAAAIEGRR